ncbi:translation initiation factor 2 subunit 3 [Strigomonas culicis]|uniref:protein-synthesizing GTPase n=1 Tax=Strigomonas culicis TaxID=28005 RepID=S9URW5_9TRYP|nr:translation initiation factor 2 subunit 3 [Strigomonas culicis]|eukprot:EPY33672.1 translation initiation factor 2 subunit 3 [Strigomonas culicis]
MNITIHLGYANAKVYQCPQCPAPTCFYSFSSAQPDATPCPECGSPMQLLRHFSFVDCPGHEVLMATMLNGAAIMDAALLLIAANEPFPQPQTREHLVGAEVCGIADLIVIQNKVDLVKMERAAAQAEVIRGYLNTYTTYKDSAIIPMAAQRGLNVPFLLHYLVHFVPVPRRPITGVASYLHVLRSFDVSRPGGQPEDIKGGVVGGSIAQGYLQPGDEVELLPGLLCVARRDGTLPTAAEVAGGAAPTYLFAPPPGELRYTPLRTKVVSLRSEANELSLAVCGGLVAVRTQLDPSLSRQDRLRGQVMRLVRRQGAAPRLTDPGSALNAPLTVYQEVDIQYFLLKEMVGSKQVEARPAHADGNTRAQLVVSANPVRALRQGEQLVLCVGTLSVAATVLRTARQVGRAVLHLGSPLCARVATRCVIGRYVDRQVRLIGVGSLV